MTANRPTTCGPKTDFAKMKDGVRGKYAERYRAFADRCRAGTNLVLLEPDIAEAFGDDQSVNAALRVLLDVAKAQVKRVR